MKNIMHRAWELRKAKGYTMSTALRLAWREARGEKAYTFFRPASGTRPAVGFAPSMLALTALVGHTRPNAWTTPAPSSQRTW